MSSLQHTRLSRLQHRIGVVLADTLSGPWWRRSLLIIGVLVGFLLGSSLRIFFRMLLMGERSTP